MSDNMFKFIMTLVPVFGAIVTYFVIPYIKSKVSQTQMEEIIKWVTKAVEAAEVLFDVPKSGEEKREYVIKFIDKMFNSKKEVITEEQIRILLEAAWKQMQDNTQTK
nr:MAG TPA: holin [Caudoviricetes sp.]